jgi:hypothetical protein
MRLTKLALGALTIVLTVWGGPVSLYAQSLEMDVTKSSLTIRVFKSGVFSAFAHDHEIKAPIEKGMIDSSANSTVQLHVDARTLRVLDPEVAADKRAEIQRTMEGLTVLDSEHFPDISYQSTTVTKTGDARWVGLGSLYLHGKTQPVVVAVSLQGGHYRGSGSFKQSSFGISPIRVAAGTIKVKDEIKVEFDIVPVQ